MKGRPGSFEWWASVVAHTARRNTARVLVVPTARRELERVLRPSAVRAILHQREWRGREVYPTKGDSGHWRSLPHWLYNRWYALSGFYIVKYWVKAVVVRSLRREEGPRSSWQQLIVMKGTRTHIGCASHMTKIERVWALYRRYPASVIAQQMLVACANALRRKGRVIPPMGGKPVGLKALAKLTNVELRRVVVEMRGVALPAKPLAKDAVGKLYRVDDSQNLLEVRCPSTGRRYLLGVPARERDRYDEKSDKWVPVPLNTPTLAQAWTLGLTQEEVKLVAQT